MTPRQKLIKICELKAELIKEHTGITDYFTEADKQDILSWNNKVCLKIIKKMELSIKIFGFLSDDAVCPWCVYQKKYQFNKVPCGDCTYKQRHGECRSKLQKNIYDDILKILRKNGIWGITDIITLQSKIKKILEK